MVVSSVVGLVVLVVEVDVVVLKVVVEVEVVVSSVVVLVVLVVVVDVVVEEVVVEVEVVVSSVVVLVLGLVSGPGGRQDEVIVPALSFGSSSAASEKNPSERRLMRCLEPL